METYLKSFNILTDDEIASVVSKAKKRTVKKGDFIIREGKICKEVSFIISGCIRSFYHSSSGEEVTYCFRFAGSFNAAYSSFITQKPTAENMQAITDVELYYFSREEIKELERTSYNWLKLLKVLAEQEFVYMEKRVFLLQKETAEKRYADMLDNQPEYLQQIPLNYLASYLGITQRHLSRIRKGISN